MIPFQRSLSLSLALSLATATMLAFAAPATQKAAPKNPAKAPAAKTAPAAKKPAADANKEKGIIDTAYKEVQVMNLFKAPDTWIGEAVSFEGTFVTFSPFALDYKSAMRSSKDYVAFLIKRPDTLSHTVPMSELKLIFPRKRADKVMDLEGDDKILIKGKVFSAALGDPWVDVDDIVILQKNPESTKNPKKKAKKNADLEP